MKLREILDRLDSPEEGYHDSEELLKELGLDGYASLATLGFTSRSITAWMCPDTWVGCDAIYLNGELIAITNQDCRKCPKTWEWLSQSTFDRVFHYVRDALEQDGGTKIELIDLDCEAGDPVYQLQYANEVLWSTHHKIASYNGEDVVMIKPANKDYLCKDVIVLYQDNQVVVSLDEIWFKVQLRQED